MELFKSVLFKLCLWLIFFFILRDICIFFGLEDITSLMFIWWFAIILLFLSILPIGKI